MRDRFWDMPQFSDQDLLTVWRNRIFNVIFLTAAVFATLPYMASVIHTIQVGWLTGTLFYTFSYFLLVGIILLHGIPFKIRAWIGVLILYSLGLFALLTIGITSSGRIYLFSFSIIASLLLGFRAGLITIGLNFIAMITIGWMIKENRLGWVIKTPDVNELWFLVTLTFLWLNTMITVSLAVLIHNLELGLNKEQTLLKTIQASETQYRLLAENTLDCIWQMDSDLEFTYINPAVFSQLGFTPEEWINSRISDHCSPEEMEKIEAIKSDAKIRFPDEMTYSFETCFLHKKGYDVPVEVIGTILVNDNGDFIGLQGSARNITERKLSQAALEESEKRLKTILYSITGL